MKTYDLRDSANKRHMTPHEWIKLICVCTLAFMFLTVMLLIISDESAPSETEEQPTVSEPVVTPPPTFNEIYRAYKQNTLRADEAYKNNRYTVTAAITGMSNDGLFNMTGGATLTMQTQVDSTIVIFYAEFEKDQEETLKQVNVGDTITFEGECLSAGTWIECELITE